MYAIYGTVFQDIWSQASWMISNKTDMDHVDHISDLVRCAGCALLKKLGGTYLDSDIISRSGIGEIRKSFDSSDGIVFAQSILEINNTPLMFRKDNPVLDLIMKEQVRILTV